MSGKRKEDKGHASDGNVDGNVPPKKAARKVQSVDSDSIVVCELSKNRKVSVRKWQGKMWIDIREFYAKDDKQLPGKKGISLNVDQWHILRDHAEEIDKALA